MLIVVFHALQNRKTKCDLVCWKNIFVYARSHASFSFLIGLLGHSNLIKSQLHNRHNKNCKHMLSLESFLWLQHSMLTSFKTMTITIALMWLFVLVQCGPELREPKYRSDKCLEICVHASGQRCTWLWVRGDDICGTGQN